jgi:uncharacterized NAD(P)/FAD-binding protein YdhS
MQSFWHPEQGNNALPAMACLTHPSLQCKIFAMATATQNLIEVSLKGRSLRALVSSARRAGRSWQSVADEIREATGVIVSRETVRGWYPDERISA